MSEILEAAQNDNIVLLTNTMQKMLSQLIKYAPDGISAVELAFFCPRAKNLQHAAVHIVPVHISKLRDRLEPFGVNIYCTASRGYWVKSADAEKLRGMI